jgi:hypothetical protein
LIAVFSFDFVMKDRSIHTLPAAELKLCLWRGAAWDDGELDLELSLSCSGSDPPSTVAVDASFSSAPGSKQRTMALTVCIHS